jgi:uncharacterized protein
MAVRMPETHAAMRQPDAVYVATHHPVTSFRRGFGQWEVHMQMTRRQVGYGLALAGMALQAPLTHAQTRELAFFTAGQGSGFLPYGQGIASIVNAQGGLKLDVKESKGSVENIGFVEGRADAIATAFLGTAYEALGGLGPFAGRRHMNLRAIAPMYETSFQIAARVTSGITGVSGLAGKRVGVGPAGGPAESFFKGLMEVAGLNVTIVNGTSAELEAAYLAGSIDAFWQGAGIPIPALKRMADQTDSVVFGLTAAELEAMLKRFPYLAPGDVAANTYRGQSQVIRSVAAWNIIIAHRDLPDSVAFDLTRAILGSPGIVDATRGAGVGTTAANASKNRVIAYHPGAARYLKERGLDVFTG